MKIRLSMELEYSDALVRDLAEKQWALLESLLKKLLGVEIETSLNPNEQLDIVELTPDERLQDLELFLDGDTGVYYYNHPTGNRVDLNHRYTTAMSQLNNIKRYNIHIPFLDDKHNTWCWLSVKGTYCGGCQTEAEAEELLNELFTEGRLTI